MRLLAAVGALSSALAIADEGPLRFEATWGDQRLRLPGRVLAVAFSADDKLVIAADTGRCALWDATSGELLRAFGSERPVVLARNGRTLFGNPLVVYDVVTGSVVTRLSQSGDLRYPLSQAMSDDGQRGYAAGNNGVVHIFDLEHGREVSSIAAHGFGRAQILPSADGTQLVTVGSNDHVLKVWSLPQGTPMATMPLPAPSEVLAISPDNRLAVVEWTDYAAGRTRNVGMVDLRAKGTPVLLRLEFPGEVGDAIFTTGGAQVLSASTNALAAWDSSTGKQVWSVCVPIGEPTVLAMSHSGALLAVGNSEGQVRLWQGSDRTLLTGPVETSGAVQSMAVSPDGGLVATGSSRGEVILWKDGAMSGRLVGHGRPGAEVVATTALGFSTDGEWLISGTSAGTLEWWDVRDGKEIGVLETAHGGVERLALLGDKAYAKSISRFGKVSLWDLAKKRERPLEGLDDARGATLSSDGRVTLFQSGAALEAISSTGKKVLEKTQLAPSSMVGISLSPDGSFGAWLGGGKLKFYDVKSGRLRWTKEWTIPTSRAPTLTSDGRYGFALEQWGAISMWDMSSGDVVARVQLDASLESPTALQVSPDNRSLLIGTSLGRIHVLQLTGAMTASRDRTPTVRIEIPRRGLDTPTAVAMANDRLAVGRVDGRITVVDASGAVLGQSQETQVPIRSLRFRYDGVLLSGGDDGVVRGLVPPAYTTGRTWYASPRAPVRSIAAPAQPGTYQVAAAFGSEIFLVWGDDARKHALFPLGIGLNEVRTLAFAPDASRVFVAGAPGENVRDPKVPRFGLIDLDLTTERLTQWVDSKPPQSVKTAMAVNAAGTRVATGDEEGSIVLWELASRRAQQVVGRHDGQVTGLAFVGDALLSCGRDKAVILWDPSTGRRVKSLALAEPVLAMDVSPNGKRAAFVEGGWDGVVTVVGLPDLNEVIRGPP